MTLKFIGSYVGISKQTEVLLFVIIGVSCTIFDASLLNISPDYLRIWTLTMDPMKMPIIMHLYIRYILTGIVVTQAATLHLYLACYIILIYPACTMERPHLILPWLFIGSVKTIILYTLTFITGLYVCVMYRFMRRACWDFVLTELVVRVPSYYMWGLILSYYRDLKELQKISADIEPKPVCAVDISARRKRAKSLVKSFYEHGVYDYDDNRQFISASTIENMVLHLGRPGKKNIVTSRSLDTLLCQMELEANREALLGVEAEDSFVTDEKMSIQDKTAQLLKVSPIEIVRAQRDRKSKTSGLVPPTISKPLLPIRSLMDISCLMKTKSGSINMENIENDVNIATNEKHSFGSETEICVVQLDGRDVLIHNVLENNINTNIDKSGQNTSSKRLDLVMSTSSKRLQKTITPALKRNHSYFSLHRMKQAGSIGKVGIPLETFDEKLTEHCTYKCDGYTKAYLRKRFLADTITPKIKAKNLK